MKSVTDSLNSTGVIAKTTFEYDASGTRAVKSGNLGDVVYVNANYTLRNSDLISKHVFAGNTRVVSKMCSVQTTGTATTVKDIGAFYYHGDHLGSSSVITDNTGKFYEHIEYFPYGEDWVDEKASSTSDSVAFKFTGKEYDPETGLYYFGARYYDPILCRWISIDKAFPNYLPKANDFDTEHNYYYYLSQNTSNKLPGMGGVFNSTNLDVYNYAINNPVKITDPDGNSIIDRAINTVKEWFGLPVNNTPPQYVNQMKNVAESRGPASACGVSSAAIASGENVNKVDEAIRVKDGKGDFLYRQSEAALTKYLKDKGFDVANLTNNGSDRKLSDTDFKSMREAIKDGKIVLFHFKGHFSIMTGYQQTGEGKGDFNYNFYDPAGDRKQGYFNNSGQNASYSQSYLKGITYRGDAYGIGR